MNLDLTDTESCTGCMQYIQVIPQLQAYELNKYQSTRYNCEKDAGNRSTSQALAPDTHTV